MPQKYSPAYIDERWIRHDWHLWIQPNIERFMLPGVDPADVIPGLARERAQKEAARERARAAEDAALAAEIEHERRVLAALKEEMKEVNAEMARWRRSLAEEETKYSPTQPRIPKRNPGGGQWTRIGGGSGQSPSPGIAQPMGNIDVGAGSSETEGLFKIGSGRTGTDSANSSGGLLKVAAADETGQRYSVNLEEEDARGSHGKKKHVGKTDRELIDALNADYQRTQSGNLEITEFREAEGSFASLERANDLVSQVLKQNSDEVDKVASGKAKGAKLEQRFDFVTGKEAFRPNGDSDPYIRDTYGVRVIIRHDTRSWRGYRVQTAFPVNNR